MNLFFQRSCKRMAIKSTFIAPMYEVIKEQLPSIKVLFNTRHPKKSVISWSRVFQVRRWINQYTI